jgi:Na+-driven multidrug efflux pump
MTFLFVLAPIVVIVAVVAMIAAIARKEGEDFEKRIRAIYLYIVSFSTLIMMIGGIIGTVVNVTNMVLPNESQYYSDYTDQAKEDSEYNYRIRIIKDGIEYAGILLVAVPIYFYHTKKAHELKED